MILVSCQGKPFSITVLQAYAPNINTEETKVEWFYEDQQDLLELTHTHTQTHTHTHKKDVIFIIGGWNAKYEIKRYLE